VGGYSAVQYKRNLPARGFRPAVYLAGMAALMGYGFWVYGRGIREAKYVPIPPSVHIVFRELRCGAAGDVRDGWAGPDELNADVRTVSSPARRCGPAFTSSLCCRRKRTATSCAATWLTRRARRSCWAARRRCTTAIGEFCVLALGCWDAGVRLELRVLTVF